MFIEIGTHWRDITPEPCAKPVLVAAEFKAALRSKFGPPPPEKTAGERATPPQKWSTSSFIR